MFDLAWTELLVIGAVALVVLGPKELPNALRTISNLTKTARKLAGEFQSGVNEIVREAELEDARKAAQSFNRNTISRAIEKVVDPSGEVKSTVTGVETEFKETRQISPVGPITPAPPAAPSPDTGPAIAAPAEPAKQDEGTESAPKAEAKA
jgi:sec-independent protein translocase protein TatB